MFLFLTVLDCRCNTCDILCDSYLQLEEHKEAMDHWSIDLYDDEDEDFDDNGNEFEEVYDETDLNGNNESTSRRFRRLCRMQHRNESPVIREHEESEMLLL